MPIINGVNLPFLPAGGMDSLGKIRHNQAPKTSQSNFDLLFKNELEKLKFSGHAQTRMESRDINLSPQEAARLEDAISKAREKGASESLVILEEKAFIVSVENSTVITVMDKNNLDSSVITNIDSAVFA